jgi:hypothetical protein
MEKMVNIDIQTCRKTAELIKDLRLRDDFYDRPFLKVSAPAEIRFRGYFYAVAICHQTYHLQQRQLNLFGWDYLEYEFTRLMKEQAGILMPGAVASMSAGDLRQQLASLFSPDGIAEHSTLDRIEERAMMLSELDQFLADNFQSKLCNLVESTGERLLNEGKGFYEVCPPLTAFADPMRKKITFLLKLLQEAEMIKILDPENFIPIMDYHMQRVLMRIGCIRIVDDNLYLKLVNKSLVDNDEEIRRACIEAFSLISALSGHVVTKMNDFFWSLGRSCCNENPLCQSGHCEKEPCTFFEIVDLEEHTECQFKSVCSGYTDPKYRSLWQPMVETHYY